MSISSIPVEMWKVEPFGVQISWLRMAVRAHNRIFGSRLQVRDYMPEVRLVGRDAFNRSIKIQGDILFVRSMLGKVR